MGRNSVHLPHSLSLASPYYRKSPKQLTSSVERKLWDALGPRRGCLSPKSTINGKEGALHFRRALTCCANRQGWYHSMETQPRASACYEPWRKVIVSRFLRLDPAITSWLPMQRTDSGRAGLLSSYPDLHTESTFGWTDNRKQG